MSNSKNVQKNNVCVILIPRLCVFILASQRYLVLPEGFQPPSIVGETIVLVPLDDRSIFARFYAFIQFCCIKFNLLPGLTCLGGLSLDQHRTAFSSLYETRTHLFEVAAIETDLGFRNHYT